MGAFISYARNTDLLPVERKYFSIGEKVNEYAFHEKLEKTYDKKHNSLIASAYLWSVI